MQFISSGGLQEYKLPVNAAPTVPTMELDNSSQLASPHIRANNPATANGTKLLSDGDRSAVMADNINSSDIMSRTIPQCLITTWVLIVLCDNSNTVANLRHYSVFTKTIGHKWTGSLCHFILSRLNEYNSSRIESIP